MSKSISKTGGSQFERRWWILVVIGLAQLMVVLDATVVNVALPPRSARFISQTTTASGS